MRDQTFERTPESAPTNSSTLFLALVLLKGRRWLILGGLLGGLLGVTVGLLTTRQYRASATLLPEGGDAGMSGLAAAASQLGLRMPTPGSAWTPSVYTRMLQSRAFYRDLATDTVAVAERGGQRVAMVDLFEIDGDTPAIRVETLQRQLAGQVDSRELKTVGAVEVALATKWPSVSLLLANKIVERLETVALSTRQAQASAERKFIDTRVNDARSGLREAEAQLEEFQQRNRIATTPSLSLTRERLAREVSLRQQVYTTLLQSQEELRVREARDTPMLTVLERPALPVLPESRRAALKGALGGMIGGFLTLLWLVVRGFTARARVDATGEREEFFTLMDSITRRRAA